MKAALYVGALATIATAGFEVAALAQSERIRQVIIYGADPCPQGSDNEIVVCARRPESDRYRIPENLREGERVRGGESWAARARSLEYVGETGIQSCSTVGPGGFTGCWAEMMRQAREDRRSNPQPRSDD